MARHPLLVYYVLAFTISLGGTLLVLAAVAVFQGGHLARQPLGTRAA